MSWPAGALELEALQREIARMDPPRREPTEGFLAGGCFVCFGTVGRGPGGAGDRGSAAAVAMEGLRVAGSGEVEGGAGAPYMPGLLAAREGPLLEGAVKALPRRPDVLLVNATGRDHPRRAGLALHLGWALDMPTIGVTHRPLLASGDHPGDDAGEASPLSIGDEQVGWWLRPRPGVLPLAVSPGWRTDLADAREVVMATVRWARTPEPIRQARRLARTRRARRQAVSPRRDAP